MINLEKEFINNGIFDTENWKKFKKKFIEIDQKYNKKKTISISSRKAKGRSFQQYIRDVLRYIFVYYKCVLDNEDIECTLMGEHGRDIKYSPLAEKYIPYDIECKNQESFNIYKTIEQCLVNTKQGRIPVIIFKKNNLKPWIAMPFDSFINDKYLLDIKNLKEKNNE
jgi:hypothetical protein